MAYSEYFAGQYDKKYGKPTKYIIGTDFFGKPYTRITFGSRTYGEYSTNFYFPAESEAQEFIDFLKTEYPNITKDY